MVSIENDVRLREIQRQYLEFLDDEEDTGKYVELVRHAISDQKKRIVVDVNDLRRKNPERVKNLLSNSSEEQLAFSRALKDFIFSLSPDYAKKVDFFHVGFQGSFGSKHVTPRTLTNRFLGSLICVEGIVTKCSLIKPKVMRSVHFCPATGKFLERKYSDMTSLEAIPTNSVYPTKDDDGNPLETEFGLSQYIDHQVISIQEMPEKAPAGQLPRAVEIICENDLVGLCKPGDRVQVVGNYRCLAGKQGGYTTGIFRCILIANNIMQLSKETGPSVSGEDVSLIKSLATSHPMEVFDILAKSLAPSIHGHDLIKKAILCLLLGGVEKILPNGTRLRGDINILLIGDPSVAKSQLLRYVLHTAPRAIATTGRGSTGVGLTACVTTDQETGERRLEAGAMVLADRGVVCIDEFDKMSDIDRTSIHEVMEQGRVSISKAGIHASLNARCSVLAAANPVYGRYDPYKTPMENIGLQDSLLSRFDLVFVLLDTINEEQDSMISEHVLRMNRYRAPTEQDGEILPMGATTDILSTFDPDANEDENKTQMYEKYDALLHGETRQRNEQYLTSDFMKKYISMVKIIKPVLTDEASEMISDAYTRLRSEDALTNDVARTQPVTARTLETMIRLSTAIAKARMSPQISADDADMAIKLIHYAYFKKVLEKKKKRARNSLGLDTSVESINRTKRRARVVDVNVDMDVDEDLASDVSANVSIVNASQSSIPELVEGDIVLTAEKYKTIKSQLSEVFRTQSEDFYNLEDLISQINKDNQFVRSELDQALKKLSDENQVMISDNKVYCIG